MPRIPRAELRTTHVFWRRKGHSILPYRWRLRRTSTVTAKQMAKPAFIMRVVRKLKMTKLFNQLVAMRTNERLRIRPAYVEALQELGQILKDMPDDE